MLTLHGLRLCSCSFYSRAFEKMFQQCLELPSQSRHSICFPLLSTHFMSCTHELCPEEVIALLGEGNVLKTCRKSFNFLSFQRHHIGDRSLSLCNMFLDEMAKQARNLITDICTEQCTLSDQVRDNNLINNYFDVLGHTILLSYFSVSVWLMILVNWRKSLAWLGLVVSITYLN